MTTPQGSIVIPCNSPDCKSAFQDKQYGKNMRVHNQCKLSGSKEPGWRCTVCGTERS